MRGKVGNNLRERAHVPVVAVNHEQRRTAAIDFGVHLEAIDVVEPPRGWIVIVRNLCGTLCVCDCGADDEWKPDGNTAAESKDSQQIHRGVSVAAR